MRWRILALLFLARIGMGIQFQTTASVGDDLAVAFGLDYAGIGLLIGLFMAPGLFLALPAGFSGRFASDRVLATGGMLALAAGGLISAGADDSGTVGLGRMVAGAGFLFATLYFTKMTADWFDGREIATAMSILVMSWPFGIAMGQIGHAWLAELYSWRVPYLVASAYCLASAAALMLFYRTPQAGGALPPMSMTLSGREWGLILCAGIAWGAFNAGYVVWLSFGPLALEERGHSELAAAGIISVASWVMILSGALCGQIADRFGRSVTILSVCTAASMASLLLLQVQGAGLAASLLFGLVAMSPAGVIMAMAGAALRPEHRAFGMGIFFTVYYAILMASPPVAGALMDATGRTAGSIAVAMVLFASVLPAALVYRRIAAGPRRLSPASGA